MAVVGLLAAGLVVPMQAAASGFAAGEAVIAHGRFGHVALLRPDGEPRAVVLDLSGDRGWTADEQARARQLREAGALVVGIDTPAFLRTLSADEDDCEFADGDLENLSRFVQAYAGLRAYHLPILVGRDSGAALAYAMLAQAPDDTFAGALAQDFCPRLALPKPLCGGERLSTRPWPGGVGVELLAAPSLHAPLVVLGTPAACPRPMLDAFLSRMPAAREAPRSSATAWLDAYRTLVPLSGAALPVPSDVADLPLTEVPARTTGSDAFAILLSGDGGWAGLDTEVAAELARHGTPVVGLDSLRYFWKARTPESLARDLDRLIAHYVAAWHRPRVWLVGYSQGADVLPFAFNRLAPASKARVAQLVPMAMQTRAAFEFHLANWIGKSGDRPLQPELHRLADDPRLLCIYGADEDDSGCAALDRSHYDVVSLPGGHHFDGDYEALAALIDRHGRRQKRG